MKYLTFGEQVKIILGRKGMTIKDLAELVEKHTGKPMSRQNMTQRLSRDNYKERDMRMIAELLGCRFTLDILEPREAAQENPGTARENPETMQEELKAVQEEPETVQEDLVTAPLGGVPENSSIACKTQSTPDTHNTDETPGMTDTRNTGEAQSTPDTVNADEAQNIPEERGMQNEGASPMAQQSLEVREAAERGITIGEFADMGEGNEEAAGVPGVTEDAPLRNAMAKTKERDLLRRGIKGYFRKKDAKPQDNVPESVGEVNPYTGKEYEPGSVRMHPDRIGYVQVYDREQHKWTDMTEWAFLGDQERKKKLLGKDYKPPVYLD